MSSTTSLVIDIDLIVLKFKGNHAMLFDISNRCQWTLRAENLSKLINTCLLSDQNPLSTTRCVI